eukprot:TRINITY_DN3877_c0_g2_i1.p1 TRINITY_DN3877_c0_g2~~TRINITY_DN3877_c0_g2_i1.p1  ORF type:complete len:540 (-),score=79.95 TRINITY_DN3877_c0_g2_i1:100-1719(-)
MYRPFSLAIVLVCIAGLTSCTVQGRKRETSHFESLMKSHTTTVKEAQREEDVLEKDSELLDDKNTEELLRVALVEEDQDFERHLQALRGSLPLDATEEQMEREREKEHDLEGSRSAKVEKLKHKYPIETATSESQASWKNWTRTLSAMVPDPLRRAQELADSFLHRHKTEMESIANPFRDVDSGECNTTKFILLHTPKTGGRSLEVSLRLHCAESSFEKLGLPVYEQDALLAVPEFMSLKNRIESAEKAENGTEKTGCRTSRGHNDYHRLRRIGSAEDDHVVRTNNALLNDNDHVYARDPCQPIVTIVRDPVTRVRSAFYTSTGRGSSTQFMKIERGKKYAQEDLLFNDAIKSGDLSFEDFVYWPDSKGARHISTHNAFMIQLVSDEYFKWTDVGHNPFEDEKVFVKLLDLAMRRLIAMDVIGVTEQLTQSMELMSATLGLGMTEWYSISNKNVYPHEELSPLLLNRIQDLNIGDLSLWVLATRVFDSRYGEMRESASVTEDEKQGFVCGKKVCHESGTNRALYAKKPWKEMCAYACVR